MHRRSWVLIGTVLLAGAACVHRSAAVSGASEPQSTDSVIVSVTNHLSDQAILFATAGSTLNYRMGYVDPGARKDFVLRFGWLFGRGLQFVARPPVGGWPSGAQIVSGYLTLNPGDIVDWGINVNGDRATIRPR